jgi:AbrB family looped-hinge helix DNA binding protein
VGKITSKYQVSIPKSLAERLGVHPGDDVEWRIAGEELRVKPRGAQPTLTIEQKLAMFDAATRRLGSGRRRRASTDRGWKREDLYDRGHTR